MSSNTKWLPLYVSDYLGDTMHLTTLQHGAYMLLLMHYWRSGPLPFDPGQLAAIAKLDPKEFKPVWAVLQPFFTANGDGTLHQKRMDWELRRWDEISDKRRAAGKRGAEAKHRSHPTNGSTPPPVVHKASDHDPKPVAIASGQNVDNLANATILPEPLPEVCQPDSGNCHPFATTFASVHSHPQKNTYLLSSQEKCARESLGPVSELEIPTDNLKALFEESLRMADAQAEAVAAAEAKRETEREHTPDVQRRANAKPRSMSCYLVGDHLTTVRSKAGYGVAA